MFPRVRKVECQFSVERSKVKVTRRQKPPQQSTSTSLQIIKSTETRSPEGAAVTVNAWQLDERPRNMSAFGDDIFSCNKAATLIDKIKNNTTRIMLKCTDPTHVLYTQFTKTKYTYN